MATVPRVAMLMTTYRHGPYVRLALQSALQQRWAGLELVIADDASPDNTWDEVQAVLAQYRGPIRVTAHRHEENVGPKEIVRYALTLTEADLIVRMHGDDMFMPNRVQRVASAAMATGAWLITHNAYFGHDHLANSQLLNPTGSTRNISALEVAGGRWTKEMLGASMSFDRRLYSEFPPLDQARLPRGGDHVLPFRAALFGKFFYIHEPLMFWRAHAGQSTEEAMDGSGAPSCFFETKHAYDLNALYYRLSDLQDHRAQVGDSAVLARIEKQLRNTIREVSARWASSRLISVRDHELSWPPRPGRF